MTLPPVVIIPGLRDPSGAWHRVLNLARHVASDVVAVAPSGISVAADVQRVRDALAAAAEPPVILAHRSGALLATLAATRRNAAHLIFVAGYMLDYGETIFEVVGGPATELSRTPVDAVGWRTLDSTYVVCGSDRVFAPEVQRRLALTRATTVMELDAAEQPFRTHAEALVQVLHEELVAVRGGALAAPLALVRTAS